MKVELSVILPTRARPESLAATLDSIAKGSLEAGRFEVVVIDNDPAGSAGPVVGAFHGRLPNLAYQVVPAPGLHAARHAGLVAAQADKLVFADDDIVAEPTWLEAIGAAFADPGVWLVTGSNLPLFEAEPPVWLQRLWAQPRREGRCIEALSLHDLGTAARDVPPPYVFGCNFAVRREVVIAAGGFNPDGLPADQWLRRGDGESRVSAHVAQRGGRARFEPGASVRHRVTRERMTAAYFDRRHHQEGVSTSYALIRAHPVFPGGGRWGRTEARGLLRALARGVLAPALLGHHLRAWRAWRRGLRDHRDAVRRDSALLAWVRKATYLHDGAC